MSRRSKLSDADWQLLIVALGSAIQYERGWMDSWVTCQDETGDEVRRTSREQIAKFNRLRKRMRHNDASDNL